MPRYVGCLERKISHGIRGWVIDLENPTTPVSVVIGIDQDFERTVEACLPRKNLWQGYEGNYGFEIKLTDLPPEILGRPPTQITASVKDTDFTCSNSPLIFDSHTVALDIIELIRADIARII